MDGNQTIKTILFWVLVILLGVFLWRFVARRDETAREIKYSEFLDQVEKDNIRQVTIYPSQSAAEVRGALRDSGASFRATIPKEGIRDLTRALRQKGVPIDVKEETRGDWATFLLNAAPLFLLVGFWIFMMRWMKSGKTGGPTP